MSGRTRFRGRPAALLLLVFGTLARAGEEEPTLRAFVEPGRRVPDTEPVRLVIEVQGTAMPDVSVGRLPALKNLRVVSGPATSSGSSFEFRNFQTRRSAYVRLVYTLLPLEPGPAEIPPIPVRIGSTVRRTDPIELEVVAGPSGPAPGRSRGRDEEAAQGEPDEEDVFLQARPSADEVWEGQPLTLSVTLYAGTPVWQFSWVARPSLASFWSEELSVEPDAEKQQVTLGGRRYTAYPVAKLVLVPTSAGEFTIGPFAAEMLVRQEGRGDFFSEFFAVRRPRRLLRKTLPIRVRVRSVPREGRPEGFSGAVGSFKLRAAFDRPEARVNEAVALKVTVEGEGALQAVQPPRLEATSDFKLFEPRVVEAKNSYADGRMVSRKTWEWVLVPFVPGDLRMPPIRFAYFDPVDSSYRIAESAGLLLLVRQAAGPSAEETTLRAELRPERRDIAFIKARRGKLREASRPLHERPIYVVLLALPAVLFPAASLLARHRATLRGDRGLARARRAGRAAARRLRAIARGSPGDGREAALGVVEALVGYVADRFDRSAAGLTYEQMDELLASRGVREESRRRLRACLDRCDFVRFAPQGGQAALPAADLVAEALAVVQALEREL